MEKFYEYKSKMLCIRRIKMCIAKWRAKLTKYVKSTKVEPTEEWIEIKVFQ